MGMLVKSKMKISFSLWSANLAELGDGMDKTGEYCDSYHFDIMDGHFVPNLLFGADIVKSLRSFTKKPFEVHLMVMHPEMFIQQFIDAGADIFIIHPETCGDINETLMSIRRKGKKVGLALKSDDKFDEILSYLPLIDYVIVMGTELGIKGVSILPETYEKIRLIKNVTIKNNYKIEVQVDGGIRKDTVPKLYEYGADIITAGSLLFNEEIDIIYQWLKDLP
jgi:ribulose-phosphate 3-epimerase